MSFTGPRGRGRAGCAASSIGCGTSRSGAALPSPETICPDGRTEIVLHLGDPMREQRVRRASSRSRATCSSARWTLPITIVPTGRCRMVGARSRPPRFTGCCRCRRTGSWDSVLDLEAVWGRWTRQTADRRLRAAPRRRRRSIASKRALEVLVASWRAAASRRSTIAQSRACRQTGGQASIDAAGERPRSEPPPVRAPFPRACRPPAAPLRAHRPFPARLPGASATKAAPRSPRAVATPIRRTWCARFGALPARRRRCWPRPTA